jgi:hypothetical protein
MKMNSSSTKVARFVAALIIFAAIAPFFGGERQQSIAVKLNAVAFGYVQELIKQGHFVPDQKGSWSQDQPSAGAENEFIRLHGFSEYAKWHLGIDERHSENAKARYKFPFGDFKNVHRCGLLAVKSRAREYGYSDIERAAAELLEVISSKKSTQ